MESLMIWIAHVFTYPTIGAAIMLCSVRRMVGDLLWVPFEALAMVSA